MTAMQASLGLSQLKRLKTFIRKRASIKARYQKQLQNLNQVKWVEPLSNTKSVAWLVTILLSDQKTRDRLHRFLQTKDIETRKVFDQIPGMPPYPTHRKFPNTKSVSQRGLSLPTFAHLSNKQIDEACRQIQEFFSKT